MRLKASDLLDGVVIEADVPIGELRIEIVGALTIGTIALTGHELPFVIIGGEDQTWGITAALAEDRSVA